MCFTPGAAAAAALQGQREAARRVLADKGVSIMAGAQVTEMRRANNGSNGSTGSASSSVASSSVASSSSSSSSSSSASSSSEAGSSGSSGGGDLAKRLVYLKDKEGQQEVGGKRGAGRGCVEHWSACVRACLPQSSACLTTLPCHAACCPLPPALPWQQILEADLVLWSAGQAPVSKAAPKQQQQPPGVGLPFPTNARGAMQTDATLRALHHQRVFALGDIAVRWGGGAVGGRMSGWLGVRATHMHRIQAVLRVSYRLC